MRGRRLTAIIAAGLLAVAAAGCGGDDSPAPEVPGPPADVALPEATVAPTADAEGSDSGNNNSDDSGSTTDQGTTDESTTPEDTGTTGDTGAAATPDTSGGTAAPEAQPDSPTNDTPPPADSEAEQFEDFCAQNPGAC